MFVCLVVPIGLRLVGYVGCCRFSVDAVSFVSVYWFWCFVCDCCGCLWLGGCFVLIGWGWWVYEWFGSVGLLLWVFWLFGCLSLLAFLGMVWFVFLQVCYN